jgi:hypothetical protein
MKAIRTSLVVLVTSAAFAIAADSAPAGDPAVQHEKSSTFDVNQLRSAAANLNATSQNVVNGSATRVSGLLVRLVKAPRRAWQLVNPFAPASEGGLEKPPVPATARAFTDSVTHESSLVLLRVGRR